MHPNERNRPFADTLTDQTSLLELPPGFLPPVRRRWPFAPLPVAGRPPLPPRQALLFGAPSRLLCALLLLLTLVLLSTTSITAAHREMRRSIAVVVDRSSRIDWAGEGDRPDDEAEWRRQ